MFAILLLGALGVIVLVAMRYSLAEPVHVRVADVPQIVSALQAAGDGSFVVLTLNVPDSPLKTVDLQLGVAEGRLGFDWVMCGDSNQAEADRFVEFARAHGYAPDLQEVNDLCSYRVHDGDLARLCVLVATEMYGRPLSDPIDVLTEGFAFPAATHSVARTTAGLVLAGLLTTSQPAHAQTPLPPVITKGLQALQEQRCRDAFDIWTSDWQWPRDLERRQSLMGSCDFLAEVGATLHGYDIFRVIHVTPHLTRIYIVLRYERHPMYLMLSAYSPVDDDWRVTAINWDRDPDNVFPITILDPQLPGRDGPAPQPRRQP
jgi:hypothetical protein